MIHIKTVNLIIVLVAIVKTFVMMIVAVVKLLIAVTLNVLQTVLAILRAVTIFVVDVIYQQNQLIQIVL